MRPTALVIATFLVLSTTACQHKVNSNNPIVIQAVTLNQAEKTVNTIGHGIKAADTVVDTTQATDPEYYAAVSPKLAAFARLNEAANQCIVTSIQHPDKPCDWKSAVAAIAQAAGSNPATLTAFGFKNPATQQKVQVGFKVLIQGLQMAAQFQN